MERSSFLLGPYLNVVLSLSGLFFVVFFFFVPRFFPLCGLFGFSLCPPPPLFLLVFFLSFCHLKSFLLIFSVHLCAGCIIAICIITVVCVFVPGMVCYSCKTLLLIDMKIKFDYVNSDLKLCKQNHSVTLQFWVRNRWFVLVSCQRTKLVTFCVCVWWWFFVVDYSQRHFNSCSFFNIPDKAKCSRFFSFISKVYTFS